MFTKIVPQRFFRYALCALLIGLVNCSARVQAEPATPEPTAGIQRSVKPGQATPAAPTAAPTRVPGNPNAPVSNETPITPQTQKNRTRITGRITDANGKPLQGARITIPKSSARIPEIAYLSDADGKYSISVPPGEYTLAAFADGYAPIEKQVNTRAEAEIELNWTLERS